MSRIKGFLILTVLGWGTLFLSRQVWTPGAPTAQTAPTASAQVPANLNNDPGSPPIQVVSDPAASTLSILWPGRAPAAKRARIIHLNPDWLAAVSTLKSGSSIELALFDDAVFKAQISEVHHYSNGAVGITAELPDDSGAVFISCCNGKMRASIEPLNESGYMVCYDSDTGQHVAIDVDREQTIQLPCGGLMTPPEDPREPTAPELSAAPAPVAQSDAPAGFTTVDVLTVYTPAALALLGNDVDSMNNSIVIAVSRANLVLSKSDTQIYLNWVANKQVAYVESGIAQTDLDRLTAPADGFMDEVHALRIEYGADLVSLAIDTSEVGGLGWLLTDSGGRPDDAFSLVYAGQISLSGDYTLIHELGHNMGCSHSKTQVLQPWKISDFSSYSAGWQWPDAKSSRGGYCTVMTYEDANNDGTKEYSRVSYFSNPSIHYVGFSTNATGHAENGDNARVLRATKAVVATYRTPVPPPDLTVVTNYPYAESFEAGYGHWRYNEGQLAWTRYVGNTPTPGTGPASASDGIYYMYVEAGGKTNQTASLYSVLDLSQLPSPEFEFSYHMAGSGMGTLLCQASVNGSDWIDLWSRTGDQGNQWNIARIPLHAYSAQSHLYLRFSGVASGTEQSDMAVDLLTVRQGDGDFDDNGLPDWWEMLHFGTVTGIDPATPALNGVNSVMECYIAGLDPQQADSRFTVSGAPSADGFVLRWTAISGRVCSVYSASNLTETFSPMQLNMAFPQTGYTDAVHRIGQFYKIDIQPEP